MTIGEAKRRAELYSALAEGKTIQVLNMEGNWVDVEVKKLNYIPETLKFRIKPEPKYRPFDTQEECWNEMLKHQPFGWVRSTMSDSLYLIESISDEINCNRAITSYNVAFEWFKFADGTPFGIKETK